MNHVWHRRETGSTVNSYRTGTAMQQYYFTQDTTTFLSLESHVGKWSIPFNIYNSIQKHSWLMFLSSTVGISKMWENWGGKLSLYSQNGAFAKAKNDIATLGHWWVVINNYTISLLFKINCSIKPALSTPLVLKVHLKLSHPLHLIVSVSP